MMNEIHSLSHTYFQKVVKTKEQYDNSYKYTQDKSLAYAPMIYELVENSQSILPQCIDPLCKLLFYFKNDYNKMLNLITYTEKSKYEDFAFCISHCFYENIFSPNTVSNRLLLLIYFLLDQEIDKLAVSTSVLSFLDVSFLSRLFKNLSRKEDIKSFLKITLSSTILKLENDDDKYICLDFEKIKDSIKVQASNKNNKLFPAYFNSLNDIKKIDNINKYLLSNIKPSRFSLHRNPSNQRNTKTFIYNDDAITDFFLYWPIVNNASIYLSELKNISEDNLLKELTKSELDLLSRNETDNITLSFLLKQISLIDDDSTIFTSSKLIKNIKGSNNPEKIATLYKISFARVKEIIDDLLYTLIHNASLIPNSIKCICAMIAKLLKLKFPDISDINLNSFIGKFFFDELIFPILFNPLYNGIITTTIISEQTRSNVITITKIIKKIIRGNLFNGTFDGEYSMTLFNMYIVEIMPSIIKFFDYLLQVKLPNCIEQAIADKEKGNNVVSSYDYFKDYPNEKMEHQSICFTWSDLVLVYEVIKNNGDVFISDPKELFSKTYKKLTFYENAFRNKQEINENENTKTYLLLTNIDYSKEFEMKINSLSKQEKFSFESCDTSENTNEKFILARVKYCISTIIRHLNILTRANFFIDASESTENFVIGLNKMIELEGFSEMLREKTIPLSWYGLYLQSNIGNIPVPHRRANYFQLYEELLKDSYTNLDNIQKDESLNYIFQKAQNCKKLIGIIDHSLENLKKIDSIIELKYIVSSVSVPVILQEIVLKKECIKLEVVDKALPLKKTSFFDKTKNIDFPCNTILQFIDKFPKYNKCPNPDNLLPHQEKLCFHISLETYFDIMSKYIYKEESLSNYTDEQKNNIIENVITFIQKKLYDRIFPIQPNTLDSVLQNNAIDLCGMKSEQLLGNSHLLNKQIIEAGLKYYKYIEKAKCPLEKLEAFIKINDLIKTNLAFCCGVNNIQEDLIIDALAYLILLTQPSHFYSNFSYIELYITNKKKPLWKKWIDLLLKVLNRAKVIKKDDFFKEKI